MSQPNTGGDQRYRVRCPDCDFLSDNTYPNALVTSAEAERHDERAHGGEETAFVESVRMLADGGQADDSVRRCLRRAAELRREAQQLEIAAVGFTRGDGV